MAHSPRGRPRVQESADDIVAGVLVAAGARVSTSDYTTRRIAGLTGLSQTLVSRAVRRIRGAGTSPPASASQIGPGLQTSTGLQLARFRVQYPQITVAFEVADAGEPLQPTSFGRRSAALLAALWVSGAAEWQPTEADPDAPTVKRVEVDEAHPQNREAPEVGAHSLTAQWNPGTGSWSAFLTEVARLLDQCRPTLDALPGDLLHQLSSRAGQGLHGVEWRRGRHGAEKASHNSDSQRLALAEFPGPQVSSSHRSQSRVNRSATEQIAITLRKEMINSGNRSGDRLSVTLLAERLGLGQAQVRNAMRQLADDGLLSHSEAGFRIPHFTGTDVIDLYASRLHVGIVIIRASAAQPRHRLLPARLALGTLEAVATQGSLTDSGEADLRFQQELAEASGLRQSAHSFHALTLRLRMFISVLQLDYAPAVERLVVDDRRLLTAVLEGRTGEAVRIWRSKLDDAVRHMSALAPDTFDPRLWSRLTQ